MTQPAFPPPAPTGPSTFVEESDALSTTAWSGPVGSAIRGAMSVMFDDLTDNVELAIRCRFPSEAPADAIQWLCADRLVTPGPNELAAHLVLRLLRWLEMARYFGTPTGVLYSIIGYVSPDFPKLEFINQGGTSYTYAAGGDPWPSGQEFPTAPAMSTTTSSYWQWDGASDPDIGIRGWWRSWLVIFSPGGAPWAAYSTTYGGGARYGDGTAYGWAGTQNDRQSILALARTYKAAHTFIPSVIVSYLSTNFPTSGGSAGVTIPDGHWGHWSKVAASGGYSAVYVSARNIPHASYLDGVR